MLHHKENLGYKIKCSNNKKLKAPNCGKLCFLAHKPDPVFVAEENLKVIKKPSSVTKSAFNVLCTAKRYRARCHPAGAAEWTINEHMDIKSLTYPAHSVTLHVCAQCGKQAPHNKCKNTVLTSQMLIYTQTLQRSVLPACLYQHVKCLWLFPSVITLDATLWINGRRLLLTVKSESLKHNALFLVKN